jgi:hypothetical protein
LPRFAADENDGLPLPADHTDAFLYLMCDACQGNGETFTLA